MNGDAKGAFVGGEAFKARGGDGARDRGLVRVAKDAKLARASTDADAVSGVRVDPVAFEELPDVDEGQAMNGAVMVDVARGFGRVPAIGAVRLESFVICPGG